MVAVDCCPGLLGLVGIYHVYGDARWAGGYGRCCDRRGPGGRKQEAEEDGETGRAENAVSMRLPPLH